MNAKLARKNKLISELIVNPLTRQSFSRAYSRINAHKINKDGRHGSVIMEITKRCNRRCRHCYSHSRPAIKMADKTIKEIIKLVRARYKHIFITGGEPALDARVLAIARSNPDIMFFMFTNGSPIDLSYARRLSKIGNLIPLLSIDGNSSGQHDYFKGKGSWLALQRAIKALNAFSVPWGFLSMVTNKNARQVLSKRFIQTLKDKGAIMGRYLEFIPVGIHTDLSLIPSAKNYYLMECRKNEIIKNYEIYMQETAQKKCLGMAFFDVNGNIKCCPFFHYAKHNVAEGNLEKLLKDSTLDWCSYRYAGECPLYSDQEGFRDHLLSRGWKPTISLNPQNSIASASAKKMSDNYRLFLKMKTEKGL